MAEGRRGQAGGACSEALRQQQFGGKASPGHAFAQNAAATESPQQPERCCGIRLRRPVCVDEAFDTADEGGVGAGVRVIVLLRRCQLDSLQTIYDKFGTF